MGPVFEPLLVSEGRKTCDNNLVPNVGPTLDRHFQNLFSTCAAHTLTIPAASGQLPDVQLKCPP